MKKFRFITNLLTSHLINYPTPANLNYFWGFGFCSGMFLTIQILTGVILAMHYNPSIELAFESVEHIMRDVNYGWFLRYSHSNGASFFFICLYIHIFKNIYYRSYKHPRQYVWYSGVLIFFLSMATAFIGYVLPWGQMSFRGATVITNLITALPFIGPDLVTWVWGGFSVSNATLNRFFSIHYILPFIIIIFILLHLALLHQVGSNNPLCVSSACDKVNFYPYFLIKDFFTFICILAVYLGMVFFYPDALGHADNYVKANPLVTPPHIVPEWYFLPFYAILRSIPSKLGGVLCMFLSIIVLFALPLLDRSYIIVAPKFSFFFEPLFWFFVITCLMLGQLGGLPVEEPYIFMARLATICYFTFFILIFYFSRVENKLLLEAILSFKKTLTKQC